MPVTIDGITGISGFDGTSSNPAIKGTDTNAGIFYPAADTVAVATNGSERLRIDSSGNLLVGTTNVLGNAFLVVKNGIAARTEAASGVTPYIQSYNGNAGTNLKTWRFGTTSGGDLLYETVNDAYSAATERIRIDSNGNIGLNTSSPTQYDTSGGKILRISGTATNSGPATVFMSGSTGVPGAGYYAQEVFSIGVSSSTEISRMTGTGANGFRSMIRVSLCGHTGSKGNGHIHAMYYWDGGTAAPVQIYRYDSGTNIPSLSFNTATNNVLITNLASSDGTNQFQGVMTIEYFMPVDFASSTYTIS